MRVKQHLLALARISPDVEPARSAQSHMRDLHPHRLAGDLDILMAPVKLVSLAWPQHQRDESGDTIAGILAPCLLPACCVPPHDVVGTIKAFALQQIMDPRHPQPVTLAALLVLFQQGVRAPLKRTDPG
ncbi:hypothetical protein A9995_15720 [Erythrobacter sp. QSSC1-22B]|nr:hypothetical protein A9995_15720 [Erythrobacter sp. QSSC1-22B]